MSVEISTQLTTIVNDYLAAHPHRSVSSLENDLVKRTTLSKIKNGTDQEITIRTILGVVRAVNPGKSLQEISTQYKGALGDQLKRVSSNTHSNNSHLRYMPTKAEKYLLDQNTFQILILSERDCGTSRNEVEKLFGLMGLNALEKLLRENVVIETNRRIYANWDDEDITYEIETVKQLLLNFVDQCYDIDRYGMKNNWLTATFKNGNKEYITPRMVNILRRTHKELKALFEEPEAQGNDVIWFGLAMDTLRKEQLNSTNKVMQ